MSPHSWTPALISISPSCLLWSGTHTALSGTILVLFKYSRTLFADRNLCSSHEEGYWGHFGHINMAFITLPRNMPAMAHLIRSFSQAKKMFCHDSPPKKRNFQIHARILAHTSLASHTVLLRERRWRKKKRKSSSSLLSFSLSRWQNNFPTLQIRARAQQRNHLPFPRSAVRISGIVHSFRAGDWASRPPILDREHWGKRGRKLGRVRFPVSTRRFPGRGKTQQVETIKIEGEGEKW